MDESKRHTVTMRQIEDIGRRIAAEYQPERVLLFGSHAWGAPTADSDVDLLVRPRRRPCQRARFAVE